jgi:DNA polymerase II small subunit
MTQSETGHLHETRRLLTCFLNAGINISPLALNYLVTLNKIPPKALSAFIDRIAFSPDFISHISLATVTEEFSDAEIFSNEEAENHNPDSKMALFPKDLPAPPDSPHFPDIIAPSQKKIENLPPSQGQKAATVSNATISSAASVIASQKNKTESPSKQIDDKQGEPEKKTDQENNSSDLGEREKEIAFIRQEKQKKWEQLQIRRSTSTFRPLAADYDAEIKIIKDPSNKLYTEGKLKEFVDLQVDKFTQLKKILKARPEGHDLIEISLLNRLENSAEVKFVGMLMEKRQTSKKNYILKFEDQTGMCTALIRPEPVELYNLVNHLLLDNVVIVEGYYSTNRDSKSGIVLVNNLVFPDAPNTRRKKYAEEDLSICFISDTHFGSKDWLGKVWHRFIEYLKGNIGNDRQIKQAGKIKYLCVAGDLVDGIGVFPNQDKRLSIVDIYKQYDACADYFAEIPEHIKIIASPGDHDAVRKAIPSPAIPKDTAKKLYDIGTTMVGCPALVNLHGVSVQMFHGTSLIDLNMSIPGLNNEDPVVTMREYIRARHLAITYGKKTEIAPLEKDWLVLDTLPDILHTGHLHKNGAGFYKGILLINSGCFQGQTSFMDNLGIVPDFGKPTIVDIKGKLTPRVIDLIEN